MDTMGQAKRIRRRHNAEFKHQVLAACAQPGASVAAVALAHGLNDNLVHKWRKRPAKSSLPALPTSGSVDLVGGFAGVVVPADGLVQSLEQRGERFTVAPHQHGQAVVHIGGGGDTGDVAVRADRDRPAVFDQRVATSSSGCRPT